MNIHCCCSDTKSCWTLCNPTDCGIPGSPVIHYLLEFAQIHVHWVGDAYLTISSLPPLLLLPLIVPSIRVFASESPLQIRWPKYWSFIFSISPSNEYSGLISFRIDWLDLLAVQGTLKSLLQHHSWKVSILQCSFLVWPISHIHTWLLEKRSLWLYEPLSAKWCFNFLICCLGLS